MKQAKLCAVWIVTLFLGVVLGVMPSSAQPAPSPGEVKAPATLEDLQWLAGHWLGDPPGGGKAEEFWTAPAAGAMMGAFRWTKGEKVVVYEFLLLEETAEGLVLRLRHFGRGSIAWEGKEEPLNFHYQSAEPGAASFQAETDDGWLRLIFRLDGEELVVVLEREAAPTQPLEFRYRKAS